MGGTPENNVNRPPGDTASKEVIKPGSPAGRPAALSELPHFRGMSQGALARRAQLTGPVRIDLFPASGGRPPLPAAYASKVSLSRAPLESTGRKTTGDAHWATGFAARAPECAASFMSDVRYEGPGFQHDPQHYAGVGRGAGANFLAYCAALGEPFPGRLGRLGLDFYEAVGYRHDWNVGSDRKPPFLPHTLQHYEHAARNAHFDPFERLVAKIYTAATAHHESERVRAKWYKLLGDAVKAGDVNREEAAAMLLQCQMFAVVDQNEILATARSFHQSYVRLSLLVGEWGERDDTPLARIDPATSAQMCGPEYYDDIGSAAWHARFWDEGIQYLLKDKLVDEPTLAKFKLPDVQTIRDRIPTEGPGYRAIYAGNIAVFNAFEADATLTHEQLIEIGTRAVDANLIGRGTERLAQMSPEDPQREGLVLLLEAMQRADAEPLSEARLQMQVSMAAMLGDEAIMPVKYEDWVGKEPSAPKRERPGAAAFRCTSRKPDVHARDRPVLTTRVHSAMTTIGAKYKRAVGGTQGCLARRSGLSIETVSPPRCMR
ncbi:hypothetical protein GWC77_17755 [Paraburkholderia sp. NMBU_R16]|uniref:hypothetical protein n=1 Tax=Paraburkholderia sp. NMBU_R16 TaxID=2698676 RepID=UPI001563E0D0|nr:hypothetical protein [Paraburkholderia sp. NMBU_R16]NRO97770.1 hypothetical protein [Paraburkholderia sp. NMBU_R16]